MHRDNITVGLVILWSITCPCTHKQEYSDGRLRFEGGPFCFAEEEAAFGITEEHAAQSRLVTDVFFRTEQYEIARAHSQSEGCCAKGELPALCAGV